MTRDDLNLFRTLKVDCAALGLEPAGADSACFCTPKGAQIFAALGCDGVHFVLLPGDERVFCVDPSLGEPGSYVLPVGEDFRAFLSYVLWCRDANPLSQLAFLPEERFRALLAEEAGAETGDLLQQKERALAAAAAAFSLAPADPWQRVRALQAAFDPAGLLYSDAYYDTLGLPNPREEDAMLPQDPNILLSVVNTKLRDQYGSLEALCEDLKADAGELQKNLAKAGYTYDPARKQFR